MPLFTVIVTTYDRPQMLAEALESVRSQSCSDFECIVVEDAPLRSSAQVPPDPRFRLIRHGQNRGVAAARNTGIELARGQYVTFLDDDDVYAPRRLESVLPLVGPAHVTICARGRLDGSRAHYRDLQGDVRDTVLDGFTPHLGQATVPTDSCPTFNERYVACQDVEWWLRLTEQLPTRSIPELGYLMRSHDGARHGNGKEARARCSQMLLEEYADYFVHHPKARAFRLERLARLQQTIGQRPAARVTALHALRARPAPRSIVLALKLMLPIP